MHFVKDCPLNKQEAFGASVSQKPIIETQWY